jgi:hypothetical protein
MRMMTSSLESVWQSLNSAHSKGSTANDGFSIKLIESTSAVRVFATWGGNLAGPGLMIDLPVAVGKAIRNQLSSRAFAVQVAEFPGLPPERIGVMTSLSDKTYSDLFLLLCGELSTAVCSASTAEAAVVALQRVIDRWRHFVERRSAPLSPERVRGLLGEVVILMRLAAHIGSLNALVQWTGPHDALRDFELDDASVEVKTFQAQTGSTVRISSPEQLESSSSRPVYLAVVEIAPNMKSGRTLSEILEVASDSVAKQPGAADLLEEKLAQYGYLSAHAAMYTEGYVVGGTRLYAVTEGFPRLAASTIPPSVEDVKFSVRLAGIEQFEINSNYVIGPPSSLEMRQGD